MATTMQPQKETKVQVTVQQPDEKVESKMGESVDASASLKQILSSLAETKRYLPQQVNSFLDTMEGKTIDDLRLEAMHLANKAQEEARRKTSETVETAKQKAQGLTDRAKARTSDLTQKGMDMVNNVVQPPLQATTGATKSIANKANERAMGIASQTWESVLPYAQSAGNTLMPYAKKAKGYLPAQAQTFVEQNIEGKTPEEVSKNALRTTRKNLLSVTEEGEPSLQQVLSEVRTATFNGTLMQNAMKLSEQAANKAFGETEVPKDSSMIRRMYNLTTKVNYGLYDLSKAQLMMARQRAMDMLNNRTDQTRQQLMNGTDYLRQQLSPYWTKIGQTPVVPSFIYRLLRGEVEMPSTGEGSKNVTASSRTSTEQVKAKATPDVTVKVDVKGNKGTDAPQATTTTTTAVSDKQSATTSASAPSGNTMEQTKGDEKIGNTNAQGLGDLGEAGMGVTTTGGETKLHSDEEHHGKKGKKQQNKL